MKYLSLLFLVFLMAWSWGFVHDEHAVPESIHLGIQEDLKQIIVDYVTQNRPDSDNLKFEKMWTERLKRNQVKATFQYSYDDMNEETGETRLQIQGYAILNRETSNENEEVWSFDELYVLDNNIEYKVPLTIQSNPTQDDE